jgi:anti-sigma B factor antagonist
MQQKNNEVEIITADDIAVVTFSSPSISASQGIDQMSQKINDFICANYPRKIIMDFFNVRFFSSQLLGLLLQVWRKLHGYGGRIVISGINPQLHRVFKITNLDKIFEFYPDKETALKALCQG